MAKIVTNLNSLVSSAASSYINNNKEQFRSTIPGPSGQRGPKGDNGTDGKSITLKSVLNNINKSITLNFSDGTSHTTDPLKGQDGKSITITNVINNDNGTMLINFSDGTSHHTRDLRGPRGFKGDTGDHVHHISYQRSKDSLGNEVGPVKPGQPGYDDTYAMWTSQEEFPEMFIGEFVVHNGWDTLTYEEKQKFDSIEFGATRNRDATELKFSDSSFTSVNVNDALVELHNNKEDVDNKDRPNGYPSLDGNGIIHTHQMPQYTITVAGKDGNVLLDKADVGLENVENIDTTNAANITSGIINDSVMKDTGVIPSTYRSVSVDSKGRVVSGTNPTTVDEYGLTDVYTKDEANELLDLKADKSDTYTKSEVYTKQEVQTALPKVGFSTDNTSTPSVGQLAWNNDESTLDLGLSGAVLQIGQEQVIRVRNGSGSTITDGTVVMLTGSTGNSGRIVVSPANVTQANIKRVLGVATETIAAGSDGFCTSFGKIRGINTTGSNVGETWLDGDVLYIKDSSNGLLTKVPPTDTQVKSPVATVVHSHTNGTLFIRVTTIDENHEKVELSLKAPILSPSFTGIPTAPTAVTGTDSTQIATTSFVVSEINKIQEW